MSEETNDVTGNAVLDIPLNQIRPFAGQPRRYFSPDGLRKLAKSIAARGQETPGTVRKLSAAECNGARFELIDGERRFRACGIANAPTFRAIVCEVENAEDQFERAVVSNFGREDHPPMEIAAAVKRLRARYTVEEVAERVAKSVSWVYQYQALLALDERVQAMLDPSLPQDKQLRFSIAARIAQRLPDQALQFRAAQHIVVEKLSYPEAEVYLARVSGAKGVVVRKDSQARSIERFITRLETDSEAILAARQIDFTQALGDKPFGELRRLLARIKTCQENIAAVQDAVRAVYEGRDLKAHRVSMQRTA